MCSSKQIALLVVVVPVVQKHNNTKHAVSCENYEVEQACFIFLAFLCQYDPEEPRGSLFRGGPWEPILRRK